MKNILAILVLVNVVSIDAWYRAETSRERWMKYYFELVELKCK